MIKRITAFASSLLLSISSLFVFAPLAHAAVDTCTWGGATNGNWNTAANWSCSTDGTAVPGAGDSLVFPYGASVTNKTLNNDLTAGTSFASITFSGTPNGGETAYSISGNAIQLSSGITVSSTGIYGTTINLDITANAPLSVALSSSLDIGSSSKTLALGAHDLTATGSQYLFIHSGITGTGNITSAYSMQLYGNSSSYTGTISSAVSTFLEAASNFTNANINLTGSSSVYVTICDGQTYNTKITVAGTSPANGAKINVNYSSCSSQSGGSGGGGGDPAGETYDEYVNASTIATTGAVTLGGTITLGADAIIATHAKTATITSAISGGYAVSVLPGSAGTVVLSSSNNTSKTANGTYAPPRKTQTIEASDQSNASLQVSGNIALTLDGKRGNMALVSGAKLLGTGTTGALSVDTTSIVAPGHSPGCLNTGNLTLNGTYEFEVKGTTACTSYDQIKVTGTVNVTDGTPSVSFIDGYKAKANEAYTIIDNDGADAVTGTFKNLAQNATFTVSGYVLRVSYTGGTGNDVVLTVVSIPGSPDTGVATLLNNPALILGLTSAAAIGSVIASRRLGFKKPRR